MHSEEVESGEQDVRLRALHFLAIHYPLFTEEEITMADKNNDKPWRGKDQVRGVSGKAPGPVRSPLDSGHVGGEDKGNKGTSVKKSG